MEVVLGELPEEMLDSLDLVVLSPGVPTDLPVVLKMKEKEIPVIGEVELAYQVSRGKVLAITGTNGKTTTTSLLGEIMKAYQPEVKVVGNIGTPYTSAALDTTDDTVTVAEISSFQLETIKEFHPAASAITNITEDHLNRHHTMEEYIRVKECITENQTMDDLCVLNYEDEILRPFGEKTDGREESTGDVLLESACVKGRHLLSGRRNPHCKERRDGASDQNRRLKTARPT